MNYGPARSISCWFCNAFTGNQKSDSAKQEIFNMQRKNNCYEIAIPVYFYFSSSCHAKADLEKEKMQSMKYFERNKRPILIGIPICF